MKRAAEESAGESSQGISDGRSITDAIRHSRIAADPDHGKDSAGCGLLRVTALFAMAMALAVIAIPAASASAASPVLSVDPVTSVGYTTAKVSGTVDPGEFSVGIFFQYVQDPTTEEWNLGPEAFTLSAPANSGSQPVSEKFSGLKPDTEYKVRLLAIDGETGTPYVSPEPYETFTTKHINSPLVTLDPVSGITISEGHFAGTVSANAPAGPLEADQEAAYETNWRFECDPECPGAPSGVVKADEGVRPVGFDATHLESNTPYEVRLIATNSNGFHETISERTFSTLLTAPVVRSSSGASDGNAGYTLEGVVNPLGSKVTDCHFEYGPVIPYAFQAACSPAPTGRTEVQRLEITAESGQFTLAFRGQKTSDLDWSSSPDQVPSGDEVKAALEGLSTIGAGQIGSVTHEFASAAYVVTFAGSLAESNLPQIVGRSGTVPLISTGFSGYVTTTTTVQGGNSLPITVEAHLTGLTPNATYHFRLSATNAAGTTKTADGIFVPTQDPAQPACPNEAARSENSSLQLAECRAFEQVSPPAKTEFPVTFESYLEGASVAYSTNATNINNSGSGAPGTFYTTNRTAAGWETVPNLNGPSGSPYTSPDGIPGGAVEIYAQDMQSSYRVTARNDQSFSSEAEPYLRNGDGSFTQIGTALPGHSAFAGLAGATPDLSHLLLNSGNAVRGAYGPGVYEFVGTGTDAPFRVDVDNSGNPVSECEPDFFGPPDAVGDALSRNGRTAFFTATGGCDGPPVDQIWARVDGETENGVSYEASESQCGRPDCNAPAPAHYQGSAVDGSVVFFTTTQQLVDEDTDEGNDLYSYRVPTPAHPDPSEALTDISALAGGSGVEEVPAVSDSGTSVLFVATGILANNDDSQGEKAQAGDHNLYLWHAGAGSPTGEIKFVGHLSSDDLVGFGLEGPEITSSGEFVVFTTSSPLTPTDTDNARDVYRYDVANGELTRVSVTVTGTGGNIDNSNSTLTVARQRIKLWHSHPAITEDGEYIAFTTPEDLSPLDGNGVADVYLWSKGHVRRISAGTAGGQDPYLDNTGRNVYFATQEALSPSDGDFVTDIYDARVEGGFRFNQPEPCAGEKCQPPPPPAVSIPDPATEGSRAPEPPPKQTCPKGKILKKGRCVKKKHFRHHKHRKHEKQAANGNHGGAK